VLLRFGRWPSNGEEPNGQEPDVLLDVSDLEVDRINLEVDDLPGPAGKAAQNIPQKGLGTILSVSGVLALLFPFIGGALGGGRGARVGQMRP
jgi:hypothetical protein